jgi:8-oxo-dGTP pyrophosphatase MutT (NUDIX family)
MKKNEDSKHNGYIRPQTCRNCGINGHLYKDCIHPIMSFGIICYKVKNNKIEYLMIQRKDSLSFMEFIRGKYQITDEEYIEELINNMTENEKEFISCGEFDKIWNYAWSQQNNNIKHTSEYLESKYKYNCLFNSNLINIFTEKERCFKYEQEWGFPKGRRKLKESNIDCAIREFCEETRILKKDINILNELEDFEEIFFGTNNILYKHLYYIGKINKEVNLQIDNKCIEQYREIRALRWYDYDDVLSKIKNINIERIELFKLVDKLIKEKEKIVNK